VSDPKRIPVVVLLGPTGVGKTAVSLQLGERLQAEIISADSRLFYRGMDIGTAKPSAQDRERIPHHLVDVTTIDQPWSLAMFLAAARAAIRDVHSRGRLPMVVGGTGQYLTALMEGWRPPPEGRDARFREDMRSLAEAHGSQALHRRLAEIDPRAAGEIAHQNVRRVIRALEIFHVTGVPPSQAKGKTPPPYRLLRVGLSLPRKELYARIDRRIDEMIDAGLVDEVRSILNAGYDPHEPALSAIGYRQIIAHLEGEISLGEAVARMRKATRQFVRRQANWFKADDPDIHWFDAGRDAVDRIYELIRAWLEGVFER
jgi:tRNA dimethylallyltransferase